jgi:DNA-binding response OmpR family regulator
MLSRPHVLVVTQNRAVANTLLSALLPQGFELSVVTTFTAAKTRLQTHPDLVIADVKLGAYNGIHLAVRAQAVEIPALVIGPDDPVLRRDAVAMGATYLSEPLDENAVATEVARLLAPARSAWMPAEPTWATPFDQTAATSWWVAGDARGSTLH